MAFFGRRDIVKAFRSNRQLQQFFLTGVTPTGTVLGTGSFGAVEEVVYKHRVCAGKKLHETLIDMGNEGVGEMVRKYLQECQLMSSLRHPNITQFLGLCFLPGTQLPLLVMERLDTSLDDLLEHMPNLPLSLKRSVLEDVACGLLYLHEMQPPVIHRDLTSKNVLLTSSLVAKITDMGNSRIVDMRRGQVARTLSRYIGVHATRSSGRQTSLRSFFGYLLIRSPCPLHYHTGDLLPSTFTNPDNVEEVRARNEVERRGRYIEMLESQINSLHPGLVVLVKQCLHNAPRERPSTEQLLTRLQGMRGQVEGEYGEGMIKLDLAKPRLAKEVKIKDKRLQQLAEQIERHEAEFEQHVQLVEAKDQEIEAKDNHIAQLQRQLQEQAQAKDNLVAQLQRDIAATNHLTVQLQKDIAAKDTHLKDLAREVQRLREESLREQQSKDAEISRLSEALKNVQASHQQELHQASPKLTWRRGPDMPYGMSEGVQSAVVQGTLYIGGGYCDSMIHNKTVMKYDIPSGEWTTLSPYTTYWFAMAAVKNQLILVGGVDGFLASKKVGVWRKGWTHPYPDMLSARYRCFAASNAEWLIVVGGLTGESLSSVEVLNIDAKQWHTAPRLPTPQNRMKLNIIRNMLYCIGGCNDNGTYSAKMYSVSLPTLLCHITTSDEEVQNQVWSETELKQTCSAPLSIRGSLLIVGGRNKDDKVISDIYLYQPNTGELVKIGDLPTPCSHCTCAMISDSEFAVVGDNKTKRMDIASIGFS